MKKDYTSDRTKNHRTMIYRGKYGRLGRTKYGVLKMVIDLDPSYPTQSKAFTELWDAESKTQAGWLRVAYLGGKELHKEATRPSGTSYHPPLSFDEVESRLLKQTELIIGDLSMRPSEDGDDE